MFAIILIIGNIQGNTGFIDYDLHPFYFIILLIALRYGYMKGLFTALCSSSLYGLFYVVHEVGIRQSDVGSFRIVYQKISSSIRISDLWETAYHPLGFIAFAMFVGLLADKDKKKILHLEQTITELKNINSRMKSDYEEIVKINENISNQLVQTEHTFNILFYKSRNLFHEDPILFYQACYDVLIHITQASKAYIFLLEGEHFMFIFPQDAQKDGQGCLEYNNTLFETARTSRNFIRLDMVEKSMLSEETPVCIGPLIHQASDTFYGLLVIQEMDFLSYNENTLLTFKNYCKWIGDILYLRSHQSHTFTSVEQRMAFDYFLQCHAAGEQSRKGYLYAQ